MRRKKQVKNANSQAFLERLQIKCSLLEDAKARPLCLTKERALLDKPCIMNTRELSPSLPDQLNSLLLICKFNNTGKTNPPAGRAQAPASSSEAFPIYNPRPRSWESWLSRSVGSGQGDLAGTVAASPGLSRCASALGLQAPHPLKVQLSFPYFPTLLQGKKPG